MIQMAADPFQTTPDDIFFEVKYRWRYLEDLRFLASTACWDDWTVSPCKWFQRIRSLPAETCWWQQQEGTKSVACQQSVWFCNPSCLCHTSSQSLLWKTFGFQWHFSWVQKMALSMLLWLTGLMYFFRCLSLRREKLKEGVTCTADTHKAVEGPLAEEWLAVSLEVESILHTPTRLDIFFAFPEMFGAISAVFAWVGFAQVISLRERLKHMRSFKLPRRWQRTVVDASTAAAILVTLFCLQCAVCFQRKDQVCQIATGGKSGG